MGHASFRNAKRVAEPWRCPNVKGVSPGTYRELQKDRIVQ